MQTSNKSEEKDQQNTPQGVDNSEGIKKYGGFKFNNKGEVSGLVRFSEEEVAQIFDKNDQTLGS